jgi:hypothetical protein
MPGRLRWIFVGDRDETEADDMDHGSCVLSKAVSPRFGTAKDANVVIVKMPFIAIAGGPGTKKMLEELDFLEALIKIRKDVRDNDLRGKAVLNLSWGCKYKVLKTQFTYEYLLMYVE